MSVLIETSLGDVVIDVLDEEAPLAAKNFIKLCKIKYYNGCLFYNLQTDYLIQTGDPSATGKGGTSVYGLMYGDQARFFEDEIRLPKRKHDRRGLVCMANMDQKHTNSSQFFITMRGEDLEHLDGKHTVFGQVEEGMDVLEKVNEQFVDDEGRPYRDIRILHTNILEDPFDDPAPLTSLIPPENPERERPEEERIPPRLGATEEFDLESGKSALEVEKAIREREAKSHAVVLEMIGDLPDADVKPPDDVLFVCKLNPVTTEDDLEIIFSRFGPCRADICKDHITGEGLNYGFIEFEEVSASEEAFRKMNNVLIDDRRIFVDFSQSVSKQWNVHKSRIQGGAKSRLQSNQLKKGGSSNALADGNVSIATNSSRSGCNHHSLTREERSNHYGRRSGAALPQHKNYNQRDKHTHHRGREQHNIRYHDDHDERRHKEHGRERYVRNLDHGDRRNDHYGGRRTRRDDSRSRSRSHDRRRRSRHDK